MPIERFHGSAQGRARAVRHDGLVYAVATAENHRTDIAEQTRLTLANLDQSLALAGTDKSQLLSATVYLTDMANKADMDVVWCQWIGAAENWPQRACVGADLAPGDMIEIVVTAVARETSA